MMKALFNLVFLFSVLVISCGPKESADDTEKKAVKDSIAKVEAPKASNDTIPHADGVFERKFSNGQVSIRGEMRNGKRQGTWFSYFENGQPQSQGEYVNGVRNGKSITWYPNGQKRFEGSYTDDKQSGAWQYWEESGKLAKEVNYDKPTSK